MKAMPAPKAMASKAMLAKSVPMCRKKNNPVSMGGNLAWMPMLAFAAAEKTKAMGKATTARNLSPSRHQSPKKMHRIAQPKG